MPEGRWVRTLGAVRNLATTLRDTVRRWISPGGPGLVGEVALVALVGLATLGGSTLAARHQEHRTVGGLVGYSLLTLAVAALPFRNRYPGGVMAVTSAAILTFTSLGYAQGPIYLPMIVALFTLVAHGRRREVAIYLVLGYLGFSFVPWLVGNDDAPTAASLIGLAVWLIALVAISEAIRYRRSQAAAALAEQAEAARRHATEERMHIARELHDVVAHNMSLISIQAGVALHLLDQRPEQARESLGLIKQASKEALVELRSILGVLRQVDEDSRQPVPSLADLDRLVDQARGSGLEVRLEVANGVAATGAVPRPIDLAAFRIVQEALTNVAKHSDRQAALVRIGEEGRDLLIEVLDEGGHRGGAPHEGFGLVGMRERAASVGGRVEAGPRPGRGFAVRAWLPMEVDE
jgi:signal transduction histidine kinase